MIIDRMIFGDFDVLDQSHVGPFFDISRQTDFKKSILFSQLASEMHGNLLSLTSEY